MIKSFTYTALNPGKKLLVFGCIHGDETCGPRAIAQIQEQLDNGALTLKSGSVTFVPVCNPKAAIANTRFTQENLNRVFNAPNAGATYEQQLANVLAPLVKQADYLLDIHSFHTQGEPVAFQDFAGQERYDFTRIQSAPYLIVGWPDVYAEEDVAAFSTEKFAFENGVIATTLEAGSHTDPQSIPNAVQSILNTMGFLGLIDFTPQPHPNMTEIRVTKVVIKEKEGSFAQDFKNITRLNAGDLIATYTDGTRLTMPCDGYLFMPNPAGLIGQEWFYLGQNQADKK